MTQEKEKEKTTNKQVAEINQSIREGIKQLADVCLTANTEQWAYLLRYSPHDIINVTFLFNHICSSVGIHAGLIVKHNAAELGNRLRQLVIDMTGYDTHDKLSEDERIKKALIELVKYAKEGGLQLLDKPFNDVPMDTMLAWLEKQGGQKPAWSEEDDAYKLFAISAVEDYYDEKILYTKTLLIS